MPAKKRSKPSKQPEGKPLATAPTLERPSAEKKTLVKLLESGAGEELGSLITQVITEQTSSFSGPIPHPAVLEQV